ncbi:hypothetical protein ABIF75_005029 [Bradyrhizobium japonicum]
MELTDLERDFLRKLLGESWVSPPTFDHEIVARLVELGLVETEPLPSGDIEYRITDARPGGGYRVNHRSANRGQIGGTITLPPY